MSENVTHVAVCDDVVRLAARHPAVPPEFNQALERHLDLARLGAATRSADRWSAELIAWARDNWPGITNGHADDGEAAREAAREAWEGKKNASDPVKKLAFVLGALTHRAADRLMKPILHHATEQHGPGASKDATIHCDVFVFHEIYASGAGGNEPAVDGSALPTALVNPYQRGVFQAPTGPRERDALKRQIEDYFRVVWQRALISMHTFSPQRDDVHGWLDRLFATLQDFYIDLDHYERVITHPDPAKFKAYLEDTRFYERTDPIIVAARGLQRGQDVPPAQVEAAFAATGERSSRYARALQKGLGYVLAGGRLWRR
ncbi:MAG TPA: hypothetical protein VFX49_20570, partial [Chloroflexota bacterium]|nr:hypothetical protein [Chloroflexota bacterium]